MATIQYSFTGDTYNATTTATNATAGAISNGSLNSIAFVSNAGYSDSPAIETRSSATTDTAAVADNKYFEFTVTADSGYALNLNSLNLKASKGSSSSPRGVVVRSDIDAYASDLCSIVLTEVWFTFESIPSINLTGAAYQGLSSITFRVYSYSPSTNGILFDDITLDLDVASSSSAHPFSQAIIIA